jgi:hypothetical protein
MHTPRVESRDVRRQHTADSTGPGPIWSNLIMRIRAGTGVTFDLDLRGFPDANMFYATKPGLRGPI